VEKRKLISKKHDVTIAGIFNIGLEEYDNNLAFISIDSLNEIFDEQGVDQISIAINHEQASKLSNTQTGIIGWFAHAWHTLKRIFITQDYEKQLVGRLQKRLPSLTITTWKEQYPDIVSSLKLEKIVMFFILALITLVASMNMISLLFMQIQHKRRDIAIFKAMGMTDKRLRSIFLKMGLSITISASLLGLVLAAAVGHALEKYPFIQIPDVYLISYLPARLDWEIVVVVFIATLLLGLLATWWATRRSTKLNVADILRND